MTGPGIDCPGDCTEAYPTGTAVQLTATPDEGFGNRGFDAAGGCTGGTLGVCDLTMFTTGRCPPSFGDIDPPGTKIKKGPKKKTSKRK